jgi:hypothetical protein
MSALTARPIQQSLTVPQEADEWSSPRRLEADRLARHTDTLYRAACALLGSRHDGEDQRYTERP